MEATGNVNVTYGQPVNSKSLLAFIFNQMKLLQDGEISANEACAQAKLAGQANKLYENELKRAALQIKMKELGMDISPTIREIESKSFDTTI